MCCCFKTNLNNKSRAVTNHKIIACFFGKTGHVAIIALEDGRTVNADWYNSICLPEVIAEIRKKNDINRRTIGHDDNASAHTVRQNVALSTIEISN